MPNILGKIRKSIRKNQSEVIAYLTGRMPQFVYGVKKFTDIPVFCFHSARYPFFETLLQFLSKNGYKTLTADELYERRLDKNYKNDGKEIVITFDDGMSSVWTTAYPLLQKYEKKIISFILPGLMCDSSIGATIDDAGSETEKIELANRDFSTQPLCSWQEVDVMHKSGLIDFQSHGMYHALISISPKVVDFIHPGFDTYHYGNIHIPIYENGEGEISRKMILGHPVYQHLPRLSGKPRYIDSVKVRDACEYHVQSHGEEVFFKRPTWRKELSYIVSSYFAKENSLLETFETEEQVDKAVEDELAMSKSLIEEKLAKTVRHFCFPWFVGSEQSAHKLAELGFLSAYLGATNGFTRKPGKSYPLCINRVQEEYLQALPGIDRYTLFTAIKNKFRKTHNK